ARVHRSGSARGVSLGPPGPPAPPPPVLAMDDISKAVGPRHRAHDDAAAVPAVAAVRPAARHVFLATKAAYAGAAIAAFDVQDHTINEHALIIRAPSGGQR